MQRSLRYLAVLYDVFSKRILTEAILTKTETKSEKKNVNFLQNSTPDFQ